MMSKYVAIEGNIGASKSTLVRSMQEDPRFSGAVLLEEPVQTWGPYLKAFYECPNKDSAFSLQVEIMRSRTEQMRDAQKKGGYILTERCNASGRNVFVNCLIDGGILDHADVSAYTSLQENTEKEYRLDKSCMAGVIYIDTRPEVCLDRSMKRARSCECNLSLDYLKKLDVMYKSWLNHLEDNDGIPVLYLRSDDLDPSVRNDRENCARAFRDRAYAFVKELGLESVDQ